MNNCTKYIWNAQPHGKTPGTSSKPSPIVSYNNKYKHTTTTLTRNQTIYKPNNENRRELHIENPKKNNSTQNKNLTNKNLNKEDIELLTFGLQYSIENK
jgi:hypothetical protein